MIRVEVNKVIHRPIEEVFNRLVNLSNYSKWLPKSRIFLDTQQISRGSVGLGTAFIDHTRIGKFEGEVEEFLRPTKVGFRMILRFAGFKVLESRPRYTLESINEGTRVHLLALGKLYGIFKIMQPYVALRAREERIRVIDVLKRSLETSSSHTGFTSQNDGLGAAVNSQLAVDA